jgi:beta-alanine--pyruvate transaminase
MPADTPRPNSLDAFWMPFTPNRAFKADPRMVIRAEGMHYYTPDGRAILDGTAGLWCVAAGHGQPRIVEGIQRAAAELDYATNFNMGHPPRSNSPTASAKSCQRISTASSSPTRVPKAPTLH